MRYLRYPALCSPRRAMWVKLGRAFSNVVSKWGDSPFSSNVHTPFGPLEKNTAMNRLIAAVIRTGQAVMQRVDWRQTGEWILFTVEKKQSDGKTSAKFTTKINKEKLRSYIKTWTYTDKSAFLPDRNICIQWHVFRLNICGSIWYFSLHTSLINQSVLGVWMRDERSQRWCDPSSSQLPSCFEDMPHIFMHRMRKRILWILKRRHDRLICLSELELSRLSPSTWFIACPSAKTSSETQQH